MLDGQPIADIQRYINTVLNADQTRLHEELLNQELQAVHDSNEAEKAAGTGSPPPDERPTSDPLAIEDDIDEEEKEERRNLLTD